MVNIHMTLESIGYFDIYQTTVSVPTYLINNIVNLSKLHPGISRSNIGGWQYEIHRSPPIWAQSILDQVIDTLPNYKIDSIWFNINGPGHYNRWHTHRIRKHAAVLYVQVPENSGHIEFRQKHQVHKIYPTVGQLLVFPSDLEHRVLMNNSTENRISVAFNLLAA